MQIKAYFDNNGHGNLHRLSNNTDSDKNLTFDNPDVIKLLENAGFVISFDNDYSANGIYFVSVRCYSDFWSGKYRFGPPRHVLYELPLQVIEAARTGKMLIVIDNQSEGLPLIRDNVDGFLEMHTAMKNLRLPPYSVVFVDNNKKLKDDYDVWRVENRKPEMIAHIDFMTGFFYFTNRIPTTPLILEALKTSKSVDFNSLNRTCRQHRTEHLYYLIKNDLIKNNLVSGHYTNNNDTKWPNIESFILNVPQDDFTKLLVDNLPLHADGSWFIDNPDHSDQHIFNHEIYKKSLLSFVTETAFTQRGMFITEKVFKPIVAGHPFIVLAQHNYLKTLRDMGYRTDFSGIDQSYDNIVNPTERFYAAHRSLKQWINTSRKQKEDSLKKSLDVIHHNQEIYKHHDYTYESYKNLWKVTEKIFAGNYNKHEES